MKALAYVAVGGTARRVPPDTALTQSGGLVWVHLDNSEGDALAWLQNEAKLPDFVTSALTAAETRPRCDEAGEGVLINLRGLSSADLDSSDPLASVRLYAEAGHVYSVTRKPLIALDAVEKDVAAGAIRDPGDLIARFATAITEGLDPEVAELGDSLDECESELEASRVFELRRHVARVRVQAIGYRRFVQPQRAALEKLAGLPVAWLEDEDRLHLATAIDRAARMTEELESIRERAAVVHDAITDLRAEQLDQRGLTISVVAMIFLPLTFITGLLGMNVKGIPYADEPWAFDAVTGLCVVLAAGVAAYFTRKHWFR